jgi:hypothetical protein
LISGGKLAIEQKNVIFIEDEKTSFEKDLDFLWKTFWEQLCPLYPNNSNLGIRKEWKVVEVPKDDEPSFIDLLLDFFGTGMVIEVIQVQ